MSRTARCLLSLSLLTACVGNAAPEVPLQQRAGLTLSPSFALEVPPSKRWAGRAAFMRARATTGGTLLVWYENTMLRAAVLDATGAAVPGTDHPLRPTVRAILDPFAEGTAFGEGLAVVWRGTDLATYALRLDARGEPLDGAAMQLSAPGSTLAPAGIACNAVACAVALANGPSIAVRVFGSDGRVAGASPTTLTTTAVAYQSVAALDDRFAIGWTETPPLSTTDLRVARVALDGRALDSVGRAITTAGGARSDLRLAGDNAGRLFASWNAVAQGARPDAFYVAVFDRDLTPISPATPYTDLYRWNGNAWWDGTQWVVRSDRASTRFLADGMRIATAWPSGPAVGPYFVGVAPGGMYLYNDTALQQWSLTATLTSSVQPMLDHWSDAGPSIDWGGSEFVVGWLRNNSITYVTRVTETGVARDVPAAPLGTGGADWESSVAVPAVVALAGSTAHFYGTVPYIGASRVSYDLATRTRAPRDNFRMGEVTYYTGIARGAGHAILVSELEVRRLNASWARTDPAPILISSAGIAGSHADFDGTNYRLAFEALVDGAYAMYTRTLSPSGDFIDAPRSLSSLGGVRAGPWLAWGGGTHLFVWVDRANQVRATRVALDGTPSTDTPPVLGVMIPPSGADYRYTHREVSVVFDGIDFVVIWVPVGTSQVRYARVTTAGVVRDTTGPLLADAVIPTRAVIATNGRGSSLVAYDAFDDDTNTRQVRGIFLRNDGAPLVDAGADAAPDVPRDAADVPAVDAHTDAPSSDVTALDASRPDASFTDAVVPDVTALDASAADASTTDVTAPDASTADASTDDVTTPDASTVDAPTVDASRADASRVDVVTTTDAPADTSATDAAADASSPPPPADEGGCTVRPHNAPTRASMAPWTLAVVALLARRRRTRR